MFNSTVAENHDRSSTMPTEIKHHGFATAGLLRAFYKLLLLPQKGDDDNYFVKENRNRSFAETAVPFVQRDVRPPMSGLGSPNVPEGHKSGLNSAH